MIELTKIRKNSGEMEGFDREKIKHSLHYAGADEKTAREIATQVWKDEWVSTDDIRQLVSTELRKKDSKAANQYDETRCLVARKAIEAAKGTARLSKNTMGRLKLKPGDEIEILYENRRHRLKTERDDETNIRCGEIRFNEADMTELNAVEGNRIVAKRHKSIY